MGAKPHGARAISNWHKGDTLVQRLQKSRKPERSTRGRKFHYIHMKAWNIWHLKFTIYGFLTVIIKTVSLITQRVWKTYRIRHVFGISNYSLYIPTKSRQMLFTDNGIFIFEPSPDIKFFAFASLE